MYIHIPLYIHHKDAAWNGLTHGYHPILHAHMHALYPPCAGLSHPVEEVGIGHGGGHSGGHGGGKEGEWAGVNGQVDGQGGG